MALNTKLRPYEVLAVAIRSEIEAADFYARLLARVKNILLQQKLKFLVLEEKKHRKILERLHSQRFPDVVLKVPEKTVRPRPKTALDEKSSILELFQAALEAEKAAETYYKDAQGVVKDVGSKKILEYLSRVERSHYFLIKSEIDLLGRFPDYYDVEDFHLGQDLFHVGP
ncbi:MAG: ferritin family protein [Candidatus Aminicenantales bacterium]